MDNRKIGEPPVGEGPDGERRRELPPIPVSYVQHSSHAPAPTMARRYAEQQSLTYFTQQAIRAGYMVPNFENKLVPIQPANVHEASWREFEKARIREEIIAEDFARRRMLEIEVRRELMMERELAKQSGEFSPFSPHVMSFSPTLPLLKQQSDVMSVEERMARSLGMGRGVSISGARNETGISEIPFQQRSVEPKVSASKPVAHSAEPMISELQSPNKEKDKIIFLAKPNISLSGVKRKADTPPVEVSSKLPSFVAVPKKNGKEDWSCALCQVSATCEQGLNDHLQGKKHKSKEAALREQKNVDHSIGLFPKKPKPINILEANDNLSMVQMVKPKVELLPCIKSGEGPSLVILDKGAKDNVTPSLDHHDDDLKKSEIAPPKQKAANKKKKKYKFWCATCKVGALSEVSLEAHRVGKKHKARLLQLSSVATPAANVESTQPVDEALEVVEETEVIDDEDAIVDRINPEEQEQVSAGDE